MKRQTYVLRDTTERVVARVHCPEGETPELAAWMVHNINMLGWRLEPFGEAREAGVVAHGWADWHGIADNLAACLRVLMDDSRELNEEDANQMLEQAQAALDDYEVAQMEVAMATPEAEVEDDEEDDDGEG